MKAKICSILVFVLLSISTAKAQNVALKSNLLSDVLFNVNAGVEVGLAPQWTMDVTGQFNTWTLSHGRRWKHWSIQPEARYWLCDRFSGHYVGLHAHMGQFNFGGFNGIYNLFGTDARKLENQRYQGWFVGAGVGYGYAWILSRHWNLEAEIGIGYSHVRYDRFNCVGCGKKTAENKKHHYFGPTKAALNLVYVF